MNFVYALGPVTFNDCKLIAIANCSSLSFLSSLGSTSQIPNIFGCLWYCLSTISTLCQDLLSTNFRGRLGCTFQSMWFQYRRCADWHLCCPEFVMTREGRTTNNSNIFNSQRSLGSVFGLFFQDWQCALVQPGHQCYSRSDIRSFQSSVTDSVLMFLHPNTFWKAFQCFP